jgi:O-antigen/teichoic acid export membrane protein
MIINIGRKDVIWNYAATFLQIAAQAVLLPFILRFLPAETVGIWTIFASIIALVLLLDFGFSPSFTRNVTYILSGVKTLKAEGFEAADNENAEVDYGLLKGLINVMRFFYSRVALVLFVVLLSAGTYYVFTLLKTYTGNRNEIIIAWFILCLVNSYLLYTFYYDALLLGMGLIKRSKQIIIIGQSLYLLVSIGLIFSGFGLIAITSAQAVSVILRRILTYRAIYTKDLKNKLENVVAHERKTIFKAVYPNAVKMGLVGVGAVLALQSQPIIGSLYLSLETIASYGITKQLLNVLGVVGMVYFNTYLPKVIQYRVQNNMAAIKNVYIKSCFFLLAIFILGGLILIFCGVWGMNIIGSKTPLLPKLYISIALVIYFLEVNHGLAAGFLLSKNKVPFFRSSIIFGVLTVILLFLFLKYLNMGVLSLIFAGGIAQVVYNNWKWPLEVIKEIKYAKSM